MCKEWNKGLLDNKNVTQKKKTRGVTSSVILLANGLKGSSYYDF